VDPQRTFENEWPALILASYGNQGVAELEGGEKLDCTYRRSVGRPICGDRVRLEAADDGAHSVAEIAPRRNQFVRADAHKRKQAVAANIDQVLIVIAPAPAPSRDLVERYLLAVTSLGMTPVLVINKADLLATADKEGTAFDRLPDYRALGYAVVEVSCKGDPGVAGLVPLLRIQTSILVGQSGVGKSSLANALIPDLGLQTNALSRSTGKGKHTTTTTIMYTVPGGGRLIDSPGVWEYGLWAVTADELAGGFAEFAPFQGKCRFNNCRHDGEPACAVAEAVKSGQVLDWRYQSYLRLLKQSR